MNQISCRIVLFGTGAISKLLTKSIKNNVQIVAYIDDYYQGELEGIPVIHLYDIATIDYDYVVVAFGDSIKGIDLLEQNGVPSEKIVGYSYSGLTYEDSVLQKDNNNNANIKLRNALIEDLFNIERCDYSL